MSHWSVNLWQSKLARRGARTTCVILVLFGKAIMKGGRGRFIHSVLYSITGLFSGATRKHVTRTAISHVYYVLYRRRCRRSAVRRRLMQVMHNARVICGALQAMNVLKVHVLAPSARQFNTVSTLLMVLSTYFISLIVVYTIIVI